MSLIKSRERLLEAVMNKDAAAVGNAMRLARALKAEDAMTDPHAYRLQAQGATRMFLSGF